MKNFNFLIAAGGTGGHLFPAISVVEELSKISPDFNFFFTGREDKIEGRVVRNLGHKFIPMDIDGLHSIFSFKNLLIPIKIYQNQKKIEKIIVENKIDAVIATGAYISFPPSRAASKLGIPFFLMESNFNPGKSISMLAKKSTILFTSFPETKNFFKNGEIKQIMYAGNPVRKTFFSKLNKEEARKKLGLEADKPVVFVFGGSLGSKIINQAIEKSLDTFVGKGIQIVWQTGEPYYKQSHENANFISDDKLPEGVLRLKFIEDMATVYEASDIVVCRSGASTMSELALLGKASILVPLQIGNNKEQEYNARYFEKNNAAIVVPQSEINNLLENKILELFDNFVQIKSIEENIKKFAKPNAAEFIANTILDFLNTNNKG